MKITYKNNSKKIGEICLEVDMSKIDIDKSSPQEIKEQIDELILLENDGSWIIGWQKQHLDLVFANINTNDKFMFAYIVLQIFNDIGELGSKNYDKVPNTFYLEISDELTIISENIVRTLYYSKIFTVISLIDIDCKLNHNFITKMLELFYANYTKSIDYTLVLTDVSVINFEQYKTNNFNNLTKLRHKLLKAYLVNSDINIFKFSREFNFKYSNPIRDDFNIFYSTVLGLREHFDVYSKSFNEITTLLNTMVKDEGE